ncbi:MAG: methyltransferase domain-containing protein [Clostridia bacterium]|nr:methyltransferase domain-containing protein [Clostridia bacterium]
MERKAAYVNLAKWFEYLNDDCGYENWSKYLLEKLRADDLTDGLDVGCGGGWFTRAFGRAGYSMTGLDISAEMLDFAQETALKEGVRGEYLLGDITKFRSPKKFTFVTAINDCFNYIPKTKLDGAFKNIRSVLQKDGILLFDISSPRKFREKIANTVSVDDRDDVTYFSFNREETDGVTMDVTLFVKRPDGGYERLDETHRQYLHTEEEILAALQRNGFTPLCVEGHLGEDKNGSDRLVFLARKGGAK